MNDLIYEFRSYDLQPGKAPCYLSLLQSRGIQVVSRHLPLLGFWMTETGRLNRLHHLWAYRDLQERATCRADLMADAGWTEDFVPAAFPLLTRQENRLMRLLSGSPALDAAVRRRRTPVVARAQDAPVLADAWHCLTTGPELPQEPAQIARFVILSGQGPGGRLAISTHDGALPDAPPAGGVLEHELMRPAAISPLC